MSVAWQLYLFCCALLSFQALEVRSQNWSEMTPIIWYDMVFLYQNHLGKIPGATPHPYITHWWVGNWLLDKFKQCIHTSKFKSIYIHFTYRCKPHLLSKRCTYINMYTHMYKLSFIKKDAKMSIYVFFTKAPQEPGPLDIICFSWLNGISSATSKQKPTIVPFRNKSKQIIHQKITKKHKTEI